MPFLSGLCCFSLLGVGFSVVEREFSVVPIPVIKPLKHVLVLFLLFTVLAVLFMSEFSLLLTLALYFSFLFSFLNRLLILMVSGKIGSFLRHSGEWGFLLLKLISLEGNSALFFMRTTLVVTLVLFSIGFAMHWFMTSERPTE
jgi:hypothetical protein